MLKFTNLGKILPTRFSHLKNLSMLKLLSDLERFLKCFSHLKNLSMLKF